MVDELLSRQFVAQYCGLPQFCCGEALGQGQGGGGGCFKWNVLLFCINKCLRGKGRWDYWLSADRNMAVRDPLRFVYKKLLNNV